MRWICFGLFLALAGCTTTRPPVAQQVVSPTTPPVALDRNFSFRKTKQFYLDPVPKGLPKNYDASLGFERTYWLYGAITAVDARQRFGNYYGFFWRARRRSDVIFRFEYRQEKLHASVQTRELHYQHVRGEILSRLAVIGDDFFDDGRVTAWRASLIVDGKVVARTQSYLWE